jgi:4-oxalocrotonate tautomerase
MPIISVKLLKGRTSEQKAMLIKELAEGAMRALKAPEESIRITLIEIDPEHWGVGTHSKAALDKNRG